MKRDVLLLITLILGMICLFIAPPVSAAPGDLQIPDGFTLVSSKGAVALYQKNYPNGSPDYVQVADLSQGAQVGVLHGQIVDSGQGQGVYGGDNPRFGRESIQQFWHDFSAANDGAFCISNGQFFRLADSPTPLPFSLKVDGQVLTDGYGIKEFPDQKLMLEIWPDRLDIRDLSKGNLYGSSAPDIVAGLTEDAEKASKLAVGRTFVGILDQNNDGRFETLLVFNTTIARPPAAASVLRGFGAQKVMMLDGGGSTQLVCNGKPLIDTDRLIPQAIGIAAGTAPAVVASSNMAKAETINAARETQHGDTVSQPVENLNQIAVNSDVGLTTDQGQVQEQQSQPVSQPSPDESQTGQNISMPSVSAEFTSRSSGRIDIGNAAWVPLLMIPVVVIMVVAVRRMQQSY